MVQNSIYSREVDGQKREIMAVNNGPSGQSGNICTIFIPSLGSCNGLTLLSESTCGPRD